MEYFRLLPAFALLCLLGRSNASLPAQQYWEAKLPNTPLPNALRDLIVADNHVGDLKIAVDTETIEDWQILYNIFNYAATATQVEQSAISNTTTFFLYKDLHPNTKMRLNFMQSKNKATFLSYQVAESIPFSSDKLSEIFDRFSVSSSSPAAKAVKRTVEQCEQPSIRGEEKHCATSLESMVDFNIAKLGKNVRLLSTEVQQETKPEQEEYTVSSGIRVVGDNAVICHKQVYPYAVFYCHSINATRVHVVPLIGQNGSKIRAVGICHMDTSEWSAHHLAFKVLGVSPGPPICHFPGRDTFVWFSN
ncbi:hypothetical protein Tsubulata_000771 [Turnera subulata]|uniref:BURP domain-containing protein n=1 Tax=Turnera subulata TaxID=218843 RepID=A0A9Q0JLF7_9ROSI|nr:hypothetical protein Tsubulata_000771 [Turnera subulata]